MDLREERCQIRRCVKELQFIGEVGWSKLWDSACDGPGVQACQGTAESQQDAEYTRNRPCLLCDVEHVTPCTKNCCR